MANKPCKSLKFPGLSDTYTFLQDDTTLSVSGAAADAKVAGDMLRSQSVEIAKKADNDGYYQEMTVGDAEQLVSSMFVEDNAPYKYRTSGGSADIGNREYVDKVVGGTIAWNQLNNNAQSSTTKYGITATKNEDGSWTINGTATANEDITFASVPRVNGHKYMIFGCPSGGSASTYYVGVGGAVADVGGGGVYAAPNSNNGYFRLDFRTGATFNNVKVYPQFFDLTQMFNSTIADAVYAMEQATAGAGVAWFRAMFPNDYYEYNAGELISVSGLQSHDMVGFNQWDEEWEVTTRNGMTSIWTKNYVPVLPNTVYCINMGHSTSSIKINQYDKNKTLIKSSDYGLTNHIRILTTESNCAFILVGFNQNYGSTYQNDVCINLSWSGTRNGEYQPYEKHSYPLDSTLTLRGVPKLSADNQLYFNGDEYLPDGTVNRRYGIVDLGTLNWSKGTFNNNVRFNCTVENSGYSGSGAFYGVVSDKYTRDEAVIAANGKDKVGVGYTASGKLLYYFRDSAYDNMTAEEVKTALSGSMLIYELATPTEETAEAYQHVQLVNDWGTEEYVSGTICPVGHETRYPANLRDKLQHLPDLASADGYYVVQQTGSQMTLVHFRIPQAPASPDGTYTLKATVSGGTPTYTWVNDNGEESGT